MGQKAMKIIFLTDNQDAFIAPCLELIAGGQVVKSTPINFVDGKAELFGYNWQQYNVQWNPMKEGFAARLSMDGKPVSSGFSPPGHEDITFFLGVEPVDVVVPDPDIPAEPAVGRYYRHGVGGPIVDHIPVGKIETAFD